MIADGGRSFRCQAHLHPGFSCAGYAINKSSRALKMALKIQFVFILLPAVAKCLHKQLNDSKTRWKVLEKFTRATLYFTLHTTMPAILMCCATRCGYKLSSKWVTTSMFFLGGLASYLVDTPQRHVQLLGYCMPKALETLSNILENRGWYQSQDWHSNLALTIAFIVIGMASLIDKKKKRLKQLKNK